MRPAGADAPWQTPFVFKTACKDFGRVTGRDEPEKYKGGLSGWSHSYVNFETAGPGPRSHRTRDATYDYTKINMAEFFFAEYAYYGLPIKEKQ